MKIQSPNGQLHAVIARSGAALLDLSSAGSKIVTTPKTDFYNFAGQVLAPWANRLEDGSWAFEGKTLVNPINEARTNCANHGLVYDRDFEIVARSDYSVSMQIDLGEDAGYPFKVTIGVDYELDDSGLICEIWVQSRESDVAVPVVIGAHPYFVMDKDSALKINAKQVAKNNDRQLPVGFESVEARQLSPNDWNETSSLALDDCFTNFSSSAEDHETLLSRPGIGKVVRVWQSAELGYQMIFITETKSGKFIAIEPQSAPANALLTGIDVVQVQPENTVEFSWGVQLLQGATNEK